MVLASVARLPSTRRVGRAAVGLITFALVAQASLAESRSHGTPAKGCLERSVPMPKAPWRKYVHVDFRFARPGRS